MEWELLTLLAHLGHAQSYVGGYDQWKSFLLFVGLRLCLGEITGCVFPRAAPPHTLHCLSKGTTQFWNI